MGYARTMLTEEVRSEGVTLGRNALHEAAAHQKRNWVRLTYACNDRCIFCLDSDTHDGEMRDRNEVKEQILEGRRKGAERLILSGGEPTIHPNFIDFVRLGRRAGYERVQTVTNGRMFRYPDFLKRSLDAGLQEITFSIHGHTAKVHDALVGVKGAFEEEVQGLDNALADGRPIINIDVVVNRGNVRHLPKIIETFVEKGVREYDLLHIIPFGRAFDEGKDTLFYDLEEAREELRAAFAWSRKPDMHIWLNRFPPPHCEGYEELIQDPYKLNDEVRGRREEFKKLMDYGEALDCRQPERCHYCYLEPLCDTLEEVRSTLSSADFEAVRHEVGWEAKQGPVFGGDPASTRRARLEQPEAGRVRLPMLSASRERVAYMPVAELAKQAGVSTLILVAERVADVGPALDGFPAMRSLHLELGDYTGFAAALDEDGRLHGRDVLSVRAGSAEEAEALLGLAQSFEVRIELRRRNEAWLFGLEELPSRLAIVQPTYERLTESAHEDVDWEAFFRDFRFEPPVEGVPHCALGRAPRASVKALDAAMLVDSGAPEIFRYTKRYIRDRFVTKSLRCGDCAYDLECEGVHINRVRASGYRVMRPVQLS